MSSMQAGVAGPQRAVTGAARAETFTSGETARLAGGEAGTGPGQRGRLVRELGGSREVVGTGLEHLVVGRAARHVLGLWR
jgi:hypothetical protein